MKLKLKRIENGYKQKEFAQLLGITPQYLRLIELDRVDPRVSVMLRAADILNTTIMDLIV